MSDLPPRLWIGGGSGAGKTTISRAIALAADLAWYRIDAHAYEHHARMVSRGLIEESARSRDDQWLTPSPAELADEFWAVSTTWFPLILEDLTGLESDVGVVVEGPQLLPSLVAPYADVDHAAWMLPDDHFRRRALSARTGSVTKFTSDPAGAFERLLERNRLLDARLQQEATDRGMGIIDVDTTRDLPTMIKEVSDRLAPALKSMPRIRTGDQRRRIRTAENDAMMANTLAFLADVKPGTPPTDPLPFLCECQHLGCDQIVPRTPPQYEQQRAMLTPITAH
jgi:hypothetical protein